MDFTPQLVEERLPPELEEFRDRCRRFFETEIVPNIDRWEAESEEQNLLCLEAYRRLCRFGFAGMSIPVEEGGSGWTVEQQKIAWQELARACHYEHVEIEFMAGIGMSLAREALEIGDQELFQAALRGEHSVAHAVTEYKGGSDFAVCETTADRVDGDGESYYILDGAKDLISCVPGHDWLRVIACTDREAYARGDRHHALSVFLVNTAWPGVVLNPVATPDLKAWHTLSTAEFHNVRVPARYRLSEENQGFYRIAAMFGARGLGEGGEFAGSRFLDQVEEARGYAEDVVLDGRPLIEHDFVRHKLVDGLALGEMLRVSGWYTAWLRKQGTLSRDELSGWGAKRRVTYKELGHQFRLQLLDIAGEDAAVFDSPVLKSFVAHRSQTARGGGVETHKFQIARAYYGREFDSRT